MDPLPDSPILLWNPHVQFEYVIALEHLTTRTDHAYIDVVELKNTLTEKNNHTMGSIFSISGSLLSLKSFNGPHQKNIRNRCMIVRA